MKFEDVVKDDTLSDEVKVALIPHLSQAEDSKKIPSWQRFLQRGPVIAALASVLTVAISETVRVQVESGDNLHEQNLERQKFEFEVIRLALSEDKDPELRASNLKFLTDIGLLSALNSNAFDDWTSSDMVPSFSSGEIGESVSSHERIERRTQYSRAIPMLLGILDQETLNESDSLINEYLQFSNRYLIYIASFDVYTTLIEFEVRLEDNYGSAPTKKLKDLGNTAIEMMREEIRKLETHFKRSFSD